MATFEFTGPDGKTYEVAGPQGATAEQAFSMLQAQMGGGPAPPTPALSAPAPRSARPTVEELDRPFIDRKAAFKGIASGLADIGNTITRAASVPVVPTDKRTDWMTNADNRAPAVERRNADRQASLKAFNDENEGGSFTAGRVAANIGATWPVGGMLGAGARVLSSAPLIGRFVEPVAQSLTTAGMRTGMAPGAASMATRIGGGATTGAATAGLVNPDEAMTGAVVGGALPPSLNVAGKIARGAAHGARSLITPQAAKDAGVIAQAGGYTPAELPAVRAALGQQGPNIVQAPPTAPQILQNAGVSQLSRTLRNSGDTAGLAAQQMQDAARLDALNRVSPVTGTVQQSGENFGNALVPQVRAADEAARRRASAAFDAVDPFDETRFILPIEQMQEAQQRYLGRGTFGGGNRAQTAIDTARNIGEETIDAVAPARPGAARQEETLAQAVRRAGGINAATPSGRGLAGELTDLRQSPGMRGMVVNGRGESVDRLAQRMHSQGFIPDDDPATLLNALRDPDLARANAHSADSDRIYQALREAGQGDAPEAMTVARPVPFREVQNLRSSIGEAHAEAQAKGRTREAAALDQMRRNIDEQVDAVAAGGGQGDEFFPPDMVGQWRDALGIHQDRLQRFRTGPQASIFRQGGDGLPAAQGAELAPKFFSPRLSQADDIAAFQQVATPETTGLLKNYAVTDAANQANAAGNLTNARYNRWLDQRSGAIGGLFDAGERATLSGVGRDLLRADNAERLGMATGSNTAQNVQSALGLGLLDSPLMNGIASRTPLIGRFTGPMLDSLRQTAKRGKVDRLGGLLADPEALERALALYQKASANRPLGLAGSSALSPLVYRSSPQLLSDR